jgi:hypothetical protein
MADKTFLYVPWAVRTDGELLMYDRTAPKEKEATPRIEGTLWRRRRNTLTRS